MASEIVMPQLSDTMEEGRIIKWLKKVGDHVNEGEPLLEVETDKADIEVEAFETGILLEITVEEGETVNVGEKIGLMGAEDEAAEAPPAEEEEKPEKEPEAKEEEEAEEEAPEEEAPTERPETVEEPPVKAEEKPAEEPEVKAEEEPQEEVVVEEEPVKEEPPKKPIAEPEEKPRRARPEVSIHMETQEAVEKFVARRAPGKSIASPLARELAKQHGIELSELEGTGPNGEIVKRDIEKALAGQAEPAAAEGETVTPEAKAEIRATPLAAILAEREGIELDEVKGTGIDGRIREIDVKAYAARRCALRGEEYKELSLMRKTIARRMTESKQTIPHFYLTMAIDMGNALKLREKLNEGKAKEEKISVNDIIVKAAALALEESPEVNSSFADDKIKVNQNINIGIATATPDGLIVPVIFDANKKSVDEIADEARDKAERARKRKLKPDEYSNATFTVSNLGMFGIEEFSAIIDPGQSGSLAVGAVTEEPIVVDGSVKTRQAVRVTLSCDHRVVDGYTGTQYLVKLREILENAAEKIS